MYEAISLRAVAATGGTRRIAVLDDDIRYIRMVERILKSEHMQVQPVTTLDVDEAMRVIAGSACDAAIVDVYMYGNALGFTLIERLRQHPPTATLPIIVASGARRELGRRVSFLQQHGCSILVKPFGIDDLVMKLRAAAATPVPATHATPLPMASHQHVAETFPGGT